MVNQKNTLDEDTTYAKELLLCEIGQKLQFAREAKGLSLEDVVRELKLNGTFLEALESGEWEKMPGEVYAIGFLRQYAGLLKIDFSDDIQRIKTNSYELTIPLTYPDAPISPNRTWVFSAALLFLLIIIVTNLFDSDDNTSSIKPVSEPAQSADTVVEKPAEDATLDTKAVVKVPHSDVMQSEPVRISTMTIDANKPDASTTAATNPSTEQSIEKTAAATSRYTFSAVTADVWLQLFEKPLEGEEALLIREALLTMGESFTIESDSPMLLTSGKPTALRIERDGVLLFEEGQLGQEDRVLKLFELE